MFFLQKSYESLLYFATLLWKKLLEFENVTLEFEKVMELNFIVRKRNTNPLARKLTHQGRVLKRDRLLGSRESKKNSNNFENILTSWLVEEYLVGLVPLINGEWESLLRRVDAFND